MSYMNVCSLSAVSLLLAQTFTPAAFAQSISGKTVNTQGEPISGVLIELANHSEVTHSNKQGNFSINNIASATFELHASAKGYSHINYTVMIAEADVSNINLVLTPSVMEVIDVHATPLHSSTIESAIPINVISADELRLKQATTLGETLKNEVGVHSSYYGSVASSPIIRGLDGPRVLIMQNGLDVGDASRVGPDHIVAAETSTATQIEVLRGPATLFYGSGAIGGVVNVVDKRVPTDSVQEIDYLLQYNDVSNERQASINLQTGTENFAINADAFWRDSKNFKLPERSGQHEKHEEESSRLVNSAITASGATIGTSYLFEQGFVGFFYGRLDREYGIPGHSHAGEEEQGVFTKMKQDRFQLLSDYNFEQRFINKLTTKFAFTDYQHQEIEAAVVGTTFKNKSMEARSDLYHQDYLGWQGTWTFHFKTSDFKAQGKEVFSPPSQSQMLALAWLEEKHFGDVLIQLGARLEQVTLNADDSEVGFPEDEHSDELAQSHGEHLVVFERQSFTPISTSLGLVWDYHAGYNLGLSAAFSQRAPSAGELFSFGPHIGTNTFEVGALFELHQEGDEIHVELAEKSPEVESSFNFDVTWRKFNGDFGFVVSAFYNHIENYYYQQDSDLLFNNEHEHGEIIETDHDEASHEEEGLPILVYQQNDVAMYGAEAQFVYQLTTKLKTSLLGDVIYTKLDDGGYLPRIPPMRLGAIINYQADKFDSEFSISHYFKQDKIAALETPTDAYTMLDAHLNYYLAGVGDDFVLYVKGQNLTDEYAQVHSSFLKEVAPLPGRNFSVGIRGSF